MSGFIDPSAQARFANVLQLSAREYQIFLLLGDGLRSSDIARQFGISLKTVESHIAHMREKMQIEHMAALRVYAAQFIERCGHLKREPMSPTGPRYTFTA